MEIIRILFIWDDKIAQMAFVGFVKNENRSYNYAMEGSVSEAKKILGSKRFDILISGYSLGDGTALDVFDLIIDTPIIIITGAGDQKIAVGAKKRGAYYYLTKDPECNYLKMLPITVESAMKRKRKQPGQAQLVAMPETTADSVGFADVKDTHILFINRAERKLTGIGEEEDVIKLKLADVTINSMNKMLSGESSPTAIRDWLFKGECAFLNRDGREIPFLMAAPAQKVLDKDSRFSLLSHVTSRIAKRWRQKL
jgi:ActR/RegA family two-component response regulator